MGEVFLMCLGKVAGVLKECNSHMPCMMENEQLNIMMEHKGLHLTEISKWSLPVQKKRNGQSSAYNDHSHKCLVVVYRELGT